MLRSVIGVVFGVALGVLVVYAAEAVGHALWPSAIAIDASDAEQMRRLVAATPTGAKIMVAAGWLVGAFLGAVGALLVARRWAPVAWVVAATILGLAATNFVAIPHPIWMQVAAFAGCPLAAVLAVRATGARYGAPPAAPRRPFA